MSDTSNYTRVKAFYRNASIVAPPIKPILVSMALAGAVMAASFYDRSTIANEALKAVEHNQKLMRHSLFGITTLPFKSIYHLDVTSLPNECRQVTASRLKLSETSQFIADKLNKPLTDLGNALDSANVISKIDFAGNINTFTNKAVEAHALCWDTPGSDIEPEDMAEAAPKAPAVPVLKVVAPRHQKN